LTYQELKAKVSEALGDVGFSIEATDDGQLVIYTDLKEVEDQDELENYEPTNEPLESLDDFLREELGDKDASLFLN
jgi:hypothetical protein